MREPVKKIALIGPESSGKTTLCRELAAHFGTTWVPEFARDYISKLNKRYTLNDIVHCAREQLKSETELLKSANRFLFCDTEMIIAKVWCEDVFKTNPASPSLKLQRGKEWIEKKIETHRYDLFLLTQPDIPFQQDDVRENPNRRAFFFEWYKRELEEKKFSYTIIGGKGVDRFLNSMEAIRKYFPDL